MSETNQLAPQYLATVPDDGYTEQGYLAEVPGLHPAISFTYRPLAQSEYNAHVRAHVRLNPYPDQQDELGFALMRGKLVSWDIVCVRGGQLLPFPIQDVNRLKPPVWEKLYSVVVGVRPRTTRTRPAAHQRTGGATEKTHPGAKAIPGGTATTDLRRL